MSSVSYDDNTLLIDVVNGGGRNEWYEVTNQFKVPDEAEGLLLSIRPVENLRLAIDYGKFDRKGKFPNLESKNVTLEGPYTPRVILLINRHDCAK